MERELSDNQYKQKITKVLLQLLEKKNYSELLEMCDEFEVDFPSRQSEAIVAVHMLAYYMTGDLLSAKNLFKKQNKEMRKSESVLMHVYIIGMILKEKKFKKMQEYVADLDRATPSDSFLAPALLVFKTWYNEEMIHYMQIGFEAIHQDTLDSLNLFIPNVKKELQKRGFRFESGFIYPPRVKVKTAFRPNIEKINQLVRQVQFLESS